MAVYVWGFGKHGQIGNGQTDTVHTPVKLEIRDEIQNVHCGGYYTAVVTGKGDIFTFGCGKYGRLGTGDEADCSEPVQIKTAEEVGVKFKKVFCGIWHGAALSTTNNVYIWGYGKSHGVLGSVAISHMSPPTCLSGPFTTKVAGVSCGNNFTVLWTTDGEAYSWGCGRHGVLGHGNENDKASPTLVSKFKDDSSVVMFMDAGFAHCGSVTNTGDVYMFGKVSDGALGIGKCKLDTISTPILVDTLKSKDICEISCSVGEKHGHTLFLSKSGCVYSVGDGYKGKLGLGDQETRLVPTQIPADNFCGEHIAHVAAGGIHSTAVSKEGRVFTWGCGSDGRLGHPEGKGHRYLFRSDVPKIIDDLVKTGHATDITCSYYHTATLIKAP